MNEFRKALFIINRFSGTGYSPQLEDRIVQISKSKNIEAVLEFTRGPKHAIELASQGKEMGASIVVAVGGDGTLNEVAQGLVGGEIPMGIIARGSGNGLARHLGVPLTVDAALHTIYTGKAFKMDTFALNEKLSLNVSGIGFDGHIANLFGGKTKRGLLGYTKLALSEFLRFKEFNATIVNPDGRSLIRSFIIAIANSSQYGNNACIAPAASVSDGLLHLNLIKKIPSYRLDFVYAVFNKTVDQSPYCDIRTITETVIESESPLPYHVDGEPCGSSNLFKIKIAPASLNIIVPKTSTKGNTL